MEGLRVAGRTSSFSFRGKSEDLRSIAQKLGVTSVLEGSVRKAGNHVRITAQLVNAADGYQLWSQEFDRDLTDILAVQAEIATAVADALKVRLLHGGTGVSAEPKQTNPEAYTQLLLGRQFFRSGNAARARAAFEKAVAIDPRYALAWAALATPLYMASWQSVDPVEMGTLQEQAVVAAEKAVALDPELALAYAVRGWVRMHRWDWPGARSDLERVVALTPNDPSAQSSYGSLLRRFGRLEDGLGHARKATELDPLDTNGWDGLGDSLLEVDQFAAARNAYRRALEIGPTDEYALNGLARSNVLAHEPTTALLEAQKLSDEGLRLQFTAMAQYELGHAEGSKSALDSLIAKIGPAVPTAVAEVYAWRGERDRAFEWLDRAFAQRDDLLSEIARDPVFRPLHDDPRYKALLSRLHLPIH